MSQHLFWTLHRLKAAQSEPPAEHAAMQPATLLAMFTAEKSRATTPAWQLRSLMKRQQVLPSSLVPLLAQSRLTRQPSQICLFVAPIFIAVPSLRAFFSQHVPWQALKDEHLVSSWHASKQPPRVLALFTATRFSAATPGSQALPLRSSQQRPFKSGYSTILHSIASKASERHTNVSKKEMIKKCVKPRYMMPPPLRFHSPSHTYPGGDEHEGRLKPLEAFYDVSESKISGGETISDDPD